MSSKPYGAGFYIHSKGARFNLQDSWAWFQRRSNLGVIVCQWQLCLWYLDRCGAVTGVSNFWWANASYVKTLCPIGRLDQGDRLEAERWIPSGGREKILVLKSRPRPSWFPSSVVQPEFYGFEVVKPLGVV